MGSEMCIRDSVTSVWCNYIVTENPFAAMMNISSHKFHNLIKVNITYNRKKYNKNIKKKLDLQCALCYSKLAMEELRLFFYALKTLIIKRN